MQFERLWAAAAAPLMCTCALASGGGDIVYVDASRPAGGSGESWDAALGTSDGVRLALEIAEPGMEIWVRGGRYVPAPALNPGARFRLRPGVGLYGGFAGGETTLVQRNIEANPTILSGDLADDDTDAVVGINSFQVVVANGADIDGSTVLDGFIIREGDASAEADAPFFRDHGGGVVCRGGARPLIANCTIERNQSRSSGGGVYVIGAGPTFVDTVIRDNESLAGGGGVQIEFSDDSAVRFDRCRILSNFTRGDGAGISAVGETGGSLDIVGSLIAGNQTLPDPGGLHAGGGLNAVGTFAVRMANCTVSGNRSDVGLIGGVRLVGSGTREVANSILWSNVGGSITDPDATITLDHCIVDGGWNGQGAGNLDLDPQLIDAINGSAAVRLGSPAIDAGNNLFVDPGADEDLDGAPRFADDICAADLGVGGGEGGAMIVDIGAAERGSPTLDCDGDGTPDACAIDAGDVPDCNRNGIPDACDIAAGSEDCNANGIPDTCEVANTLVAESDRFEYVGSAIERSFLIETVAPAAGDVLIEGDGRGDFESPDEFVRVEVGGVPVGAIFTRVGNCVNSGADDELIVPMAEWNSIIDGATSVIVRLVPTDTVDTLACGEPVSFMEFVVSYPVAGLNDADMDNIPDGCSKLLCPADLDESLEVNLVDVLIMLSAWGDCPVGEPCVGDLDGSGTVGFDDLLAVLLDWGPCPF